MMPCHPQIGERKQRHDLPSVFLQPAISEDDFRFAVQPIFEQGIVGDLGSRAFDGMNQTALFFEANVRFHAEAPLIAFLGLAHLRVPFFVLILGGAWRSDQGGIHDRPPLHAQALPVQDCIDLAKMAILAAAWRRAWDRVIPFFAFPPAIRRVIYTTNAIESINARLRKIIKTRGHFPSDDAATKLIWLALRNITADWGRAAKDWKETMNQFAILYAERFEAARG